MSEMRVDWGGVRTLHGVGLDPGLVEAVVSARDMEQGHRDLMLLEGVVYYNRCLSEVMKASSMLFSTLMIIFHTQ